MKPINNVSVLAVLSLSLSLSVSLGAQTMPLASTAGVETGGSWRATERGPHHRTVWRTTWKTNSLGVVTASTNCVVELATGMHFHSGNEWVESMEQIDILPDGRAAATNGQHKVWFPPDIFDGVIDLVTPDGKHLKSRPLCIAYFDGSNNVLIAELKSSVGQVRSNQVVYPDAFTELRADLALTYRKSGLESDLVLREPPPGPAAYGLDPARSRLELLTEFFDTPDPQVKALGTNRLSALRDHSLRFGAMKMIRGNAFSTAEGHSERQGAGRAELGNEPRPFETPVYKSWERLPDDQNPHLLRTFLIEEVPFQRIEAHLQRLNAGTNAVRRTASIGSELRKPSRTRLLPPMRLTQMSAKKIQLAQADFNQPGFVLDYVIVTSELGDRLTAGEYSVEDNVYFDTLYFDANVTVSYTHSRLVVGRALPGQDYGAAPTVFDGGGYEGVALEITDSTYHEGILDTGAFSYGGTKTRFINFDSGTAVMISCFSPSSPQEIFGCHFENCLTAIYQTAPEFAAEVSVSCSEFVNCDYVFWGNSQSCDSYHPPSTFTIESSPFTIGSGDTLYADIALCQEPDGRTYADYPSALELFWVNDNNWSAGGGAYWGSGGCYPSYFPLPTPVPGDSPPYFTGCDYQPHVSASALGLGGKTVNRFIMRYSAGGVGWRGPLPVNSSPTAICKEVMVPKGMPNPVTFYLSGYGDCDCGELLTFALVPGSGPDHAQSFSLAANGTVTYRPQDDYEGTDGFDFTVSHCGVSSSPAHVTIYFVERPNLRAICLSGAVALEWDIPPGNVIPASRISRFILMRSINGGPNGIIASLNADPSASVHWYIDEDTYGSSYCYKVLYEIVDACNGTSLQSPLSSEACAGQCGPPPLEGCGSGISSWHFTDEGFIAGGQNGAFREYDDPSSVPASPWSIQSANNLSLRLSFEDDKNCRDYNPNTQKGSADAVVWVITCNQPMTITWSGLGEREDSDFEKMELYVDGNLVSQAHAPGGKLGCDGGMGPVVSDPPPPQSVNLPIGRHTLHIQSTTQDWNYHFGAYYQFGLSFPPPY